MKAQKFGGQWTGEKLEVLKKYLEAYAIALKNQPFNIIYIDAFAGTGQIDYKKNKLYKNIISLFDKDEIQERKEFLDGSTKIALETSPSFDKYVFIEKTKEKCNELEKLKTQYEKRNIEIYRDDANKCLIDICNSIDWNKNRAVVFIDPYGMQVKWETLEYISKNSRIDLWYLFPIDATNRLLKRNGQIDEANKKTLDDTLGTDEWFNEFYEKNKQMDIFKGTNDLTKICNFDKIVLFIDKRLKDIFIAVAKKPKILKNSKEHTLYAFYFATSNDSEKAQKLALKIANHILSKV